MRGTPSPGVFVDMRYCYVWLLTLSGQRPRTGIVASCNLGQRNVWNMAQSMGEFLLLFLLILYLGQHHT